MSALYAMRYVGKEGLGFGAIYIGHGKIVGIDAANGRYQGTYTENGGRMKGLVSMSAPPGGAMLVTGATLPAGKKMTVMFDWPDTFANGQPQQLNVGGSQVSVTMEKVGDTP